MKTNLDYLFRVEPPWIFIGNGEVERRNWNPSDFYSREGVNVCVRRLRAQKMTTTAALMDEFAAAFQFFDGFGENWYALAECLSSLDEWLPADGYILVIERAEELLKNDNSEQIGALMTTLNEAGEWWSRPIASNDRFDRSGIPFHALLNIAQAEPRAVERLRRAAAAVSVPIRD